MACGKLAKKRVVGRILIIVLLLSFVTATELGFRMPFRRMPPPDLSGLPTYADVDPDRYPRQEMQFTSGENQLYGCLFEAENAAGTVLIVHGFASSGEAHLPETMFLVDHGFSVFTYDATGMGRSEGNSTVGLAQSRVDAINAAKFLQELGTDGPLFLYGHSMGGYGVLAALGETGAEGAVCVNGFRSPVAMMHRTAKRYVGVLADISYPILLLRNRLTFGPEGNTDALQAAEKAGVPVLILNGDDDTLVPEKAKLLPESGGNFHVETVEGGHTGIWLEKDGSINEDVMQSVVEFYQSIA